MPDPRVAVVVTTYNGKAATLECLRSLAANRYSAFDVLVMDDASTDGTEEAVGAEIPNARVVRHAANLGSARNLNRGIERSMDAAYVLVLNNDVAVAGDFIERLVAAVVIDLRMLYYEDPDRLWAESSAAAARRGGARSRACGDAPLPQVARRCVTRPWHRAAANPAAASR